MPFWSYIHSLSVDHSPKSSYSSSSACKPAPHWYSGENGFCPQYMRAMRAIVWSGFSSNDAMHDFCPCAIRPSATIVVSIDLPWPLTPPQTVISPGRNSNVPNVFAHGMNTFGRVPFRRSLSFRSATQVCAGSTFAFGSDSVRYAEKSISSVSSSTMHSPFRLAPHFTPSCASVWAVPKCMADTNHSSSGTLACLQNILGSGFVVADGLHR